MPQPPLSLEEAVETTVFRALVEVLRANPVLDDVIQTWEVLDGASPTVQPPTTSQMPYLRVRAGPSDMQIAEESAWSIDFSVFVEIATAGTNQDDQTNLWGAVRLALSHSTLFQDADVQAYLRAAGCTRHRVSRPQFGLYPPPSADKPSPAQDHFGWAVVSLYMIIPFGPES
jgi:hypothetical protein